MLQHRAVIMICLFVGLTCSEQAIYAADGRWQAERARLRQQRVTLTEQAVADRVRRADETIAAIDELLDVATKNRARRSSCNAWPFSRRITPPGPRARGCCR